MKTCFPLSRFLAALMPHSTKVLISGNRDQLMDTPSCLKVEPLQASIESFLCGGNVGHSQNYKQYRPIFQDEKSLMWMSAVQDYVKGEPSITYLQVKSVFFIQYVLYIYVGLNYCERDLSAQFVKQLFVCLSLFICRKKKLDEGFCVELLIRRTRPPASELVRKR